MNVRLARAEDEALLAEIFLRARVQAFPWCDPELFLLEDFEEETLGEVVTVAEDAEGRVLGFMSVWERERFVHHLYVDPEAQGRGAGTALLESLDGRHALKCQVQNARAMRFYLRRGWRETGRGKDLMGEYAALESGF